jgi:hypothetical protein
MAGSYRLNHPKNYVGVPLAVAADGPTAALIHDNVAMPGAAKLGAYALGFVTNDDTLTPRGSTLVDDITETYASPTAALDVIGELYGQQGQFADQCPAMAAAVRQHLVDHAPTQTIISVLQAHGGSLTLAELAQALFDTVPAFCESFLIDADAELTMALEGADGPPDRLAETDIYHSNVTFQFKSVLCHLDILTLPGSDTDSLDPTADRWELTAAFGGEC